MYTNFNIANLIVRLKGAAQKRLVSVKVPYNIFFLAVLRVLWVNGVINGFFVYGSFILVFLKYYRLRPAFRDLRIVSRPGRRVYWRLQTLSLKFSSKNFSGFYIISTHKGIVTSNSCLLDLLTSGEIILQVII